MWRIWVAAIFWGLNWPAVKVLLSGAGPWTIRTVGLGGGALLLAAIARASGQSLSIPRTAYGRLIVASLLGVTGFNICAVFAQMNLPTSRAAILTFTMPIWAAAFAWLFLGEPIDRLRAAALAFGAAGLALLSMPFWPAMAAGSVPIGLVFVLGAALSWAAGTVYIKGHPIELSPLVSTAWQVGIAALVCGVGLALFETPRLELHRPEIAANMAFHIILPQALCYWLWFSLVTRVPASTAALGTLLVPLVGVTSAMALLGEQPTVSDFAGFALVLAAVLLDQVLRSRRPGGPEKSKLPA